MLGPRFRFYTAEYGNKPWIFHIKLCYCRHLCYHGIILLTLLHSVMEGTDMIVKQVTVTIENKEGKLKEVMDILGAHDINVEALSSADTVVRLIMPDPEKGKELLSSFGYEVELVDVLRIGVASKPGMLGKLLTSLASAGINLEYMYAFATGSGDQMILGPSDVRLADELLKDY